MTIIKDDVKHQWQIDNWTEENTLILKEDELLIIGKYGVPIRFKEYEVEEIIESFRKEEYFFATENLNVSASSLTGNLLMENFHIRLADINDQDYFVSITYSEILLLREFIVQYNNNCNWRTVVEDGTEIYLDEEEIIVIDKQKEVDVVMKTKDFLNIKENEDGTYTVDGYTTNGKESQPHDLRPVTYTYIKQLVNVYSKKHR